MAINKKNLSIFSYFIFYLKQYQDTKDSLNEIYGLISKQFNDLEPTTPSTQETISATSPVNN